ncbi:MAG TPA: hypothetical protein VMX16_14975 [Terriglobia bacterium]|nr:hypothetical protein [Terriglobia bacterium]
MPKSKPRAADILPGFIRLARSFRPEISKEKKLLALGGVTVFYRFVFNCCRRGQQA